MNGVRATPFVQMGDHMQEHKGPTIRCPVCHYVAVLVLPAEDRDMDMYRCVSAFRHMFWIAKEDE